jgi:hypothetical protein
MYTRPSGGSREGAGGRPPPPKILKKSKNTLDLMGFQLKKNTH